MYYKLAVVSLPREIVIIFKLYTRQEKLFILDGAEVECFPAITEDMKSDPLSDNSFTSLTVGLEIHAKCKRQDNTCPYGLVG